MLANWKGRILARHPELGLNHHARRQSGTFKSGFPSLPDSTRRRACALPAGPGECGFRQGKGCPWLHETVKEMACSKTVQEAFMRTLPNSAVQVRDLVRAFGEVPPRRKAM